MRWLYAWLVLAAAVMVTVWLFPGISVDWSPGVYLAIAAVFAVVNLLLGTVLRLFSLPVIVLTLGLFALVINMVMLLVTAVFMDSLHIDNLAAAFGGALVISIVRALLAFVVDRVRVA
jgi:putative membrane protein